MPERSAHPGGTLSGILNGFNPLDFAIYLGADSSPNIPSSVTGETHPFALYTCEIGVLTLETSDARVLYSELSLVTSRE